jgi:hypothetical protein
MEYIDHKDSTLARIRDHQCAQRLHLRRLRQNHAANAWGVAAGIHPAGLVHGWHQAWR